MKWGIFEKILNEIKENINDAKVAVLYHGGEPLLNKDLFRMAYKLKKVGIKKIKMDTNGMLLDDEACTKMAQSDIDDLYISLNGTSPEMNNKIRVNSDCKVVIENIKKLCNKKKELHSSKPRITIFSVQFPDDSKLDGYPQKVLPPETPKWIADEFKGYDVIIMPGYAYIWPVMDIDESFFKIIKIYDSKANYCDHVVNTITIRYDGTVVPCCYDITSACPMGNILQNSIKEIWNNEKYIQLRKSIYEGKLWPLCKNCSIVNSSLYLGLKN